MVSQLENELGCIKHYSDVHEPNIIVNSVRVDYWTVAIKRKITNIKTSLSTVGMDPNS